MAIILYPKRTIFYLLNGGDYKGRAKDAEDRKLTSEINENWEDMVVSQK